MNKDNTQLALNRGSNELIKPEARVDINIRKAIDDKADFQFIDALQKQHGNALGFMYRTALENYIKSGDVLIAETMPPLGSDGKPIKGVRGTPLGYCMGRDKYFKREDVGVLYQLAVKETRRRSLIGAMLVQSMFENAAYGCKLFCCWCAQDLYSNHFWEAIGFVPLAYRTGSEKKSRIHIFWQKRIRAGDTDTPYWFPSQTSAGAIGEDRLVIPIPPDTHWSDAKPMVIPGVPEFAKLESGTSNLLTTDLCSLGSEPEPRKKKQRRKKLKLTDKQKQLSTGGGLWFPPPQGQEGSPPDVDEAHSKSRKKAKKPRRKYHSKYVQAARELCARYLDEVNEHQGLLPEGWTQGKYDVSRDRMLDTSKIDPRKLEGDNTAPMDETRFLDAA